MKGGKKQKPRGIKQKIREEKKREERIGLAVVLFSVLVLVMIVSGFTLNSLLNQLSTSQQVSFSSEPKAAIVDHLSLTMPNQTFIETATTTLEQAGYTVDYYSGEEVTVEFYRNLPTHGYRIVILRVHSALVSADKPPVTLFTSEPYSQTGYISEQLAGQVGWVTYKFENGKPTEPTYFGISPLFVKKSMKGEFQDATIVMMGCNGLTYTDMAEAFIERGAKAYISWSDAVLPMHTDSATTHLLQHLLIEKRTVKQALEDTNRDTGPDSTYNSLLLAYPEE